MCKTFLQLPKDRAIVQDKTCAIAIGVPYVVSKYHQNKNKPKYLTLYESEGLGIKNNLLDYQIIHKILALSLENLSDYKLPSAYNLYKFGFEYNFHFSVDSLKLKNMYILKCMMCNKTLLDKDNINIIDSLMILDGLKAVKTYLHKLGFKEVEYV